MRLARSGLPDTAVRPSGLRYMPLGGRRRVRSGWWRYWDTWTSFFPGPGRVFRGLEGRGCREKKKRACAEPEAGRQVGKWGHSSWGPHLSLGVSGIGLSLTHGSSSLFKLIAVDTGDRERMRQEPRKSVCPRPVLTQTPPVFFVLPATQPPCLSVHHTGSAAGLLPRVVILHQAGNELVRQLRRQGQRWAPT